MHRDHCLFLITACLQQALAQLTLPVTLGTQIMTPGAVFAGTRMAGVLPDQLRRC